MDLEAIAHELYGLPASEFTAARDARAAELRRAKKRTLALAVKDLRRPSAAAEALNRLVRVQPAASSQLVALGDQLRAAQARLSGEDLRALGRRRREVVSALSRAVGDLARAQGRPLSAAAERGVTATLEAALADPSAAVALATGRLTHTLEHSGLGGIDLEDAVGGFTVGPEVPSLSEVNAADTGEGDAPSAKVSAAEAEVAAAEAAAEEADRALEAAAKGATAAARRFTEARAALEDLERMLEVAQHALDTASAEADRLAAERDQVTARALRLRHDAEAARQRAGRPNHPD